MTDLNHVVLIGRLTRDLGSDEKNFGYVGNGQARANVSIAVNRSRKQADGSWGDEVSYFDITIWGKTSENLKPYLTKGKMIAVDGHLKQDRWEKDGQKFSKVSIIADNVQLLGGKSDGGQSSGAPIFRPVENNSVENNSYSGEEGDFPEDIPF